MTFLDNKEILFFGPSNKFDNDTDLSYFNNFDIVFVNNKFIELLQPNLNNITGKKFLLILLLNGVFTEGNPETISKYKSSVDLFFVSETCLINNLLNLGISKEKIISMANNYQKFGYKGCPNMFPKLLMLFSDNNVKLKKFSISGITFYMDLLENTNIDNTYHPNYHNWETKIPKELTHLSNDKKMEYHLEKIRKNGTEIPSTITQKHYILENFNFFLRYYNENKNNVQFDLDNFVEKLVKTNSLIN